MCPSLRPVSWIGRRKIAEIRYQIIRLVKQRFFLLADNIDGAFHRIGFKIAEILKHIPFREVPSDSALRPGREAPPPPPRMA